jgi:hypothetical protein
LTAVFERFTDRARRVVVLAQEEARLLNHDYIGSEHLLLGLAAEREGIAAQVLSSFTIGVAEVRAQVEEIVGRGGTAPSGHIPFTPRAKKVLELSLRESLQLGHNYIGTEHILLGLLREGTGVATRVLERLGADLEAVGDRVLELVGSEPRDEPPPTEPAAAPRCSFCGREDARVDRVLVAGSFRLCSECARSAVAQLDALPTDAPKVVRYRRTEVAIADKDAAVAAIERAFEAVIGPTSLAPADARWAVEGGDRCLPLLEVMREGARHSPIVLNDVTVERVRFFDPASAEVSLGFWPVGSSQPFLLPAHAVLEDGTWKVSRVSVEHFARQAQQFRRPPGF